MVLLLIGIILILVFSWVQYLYVRRPRRLYVWLTGILIWALVNQILGLWGEVRTSFILLVVSIGIQWLYYWLFFHRFSQTQGRRTSA